MRQRSRVLIIMLMTVSLLATGAAQAESIFVDRSSPAGGDGSASAPYRTITEALELARTIRFGADGSLASKERINVHVAAGTYVGSFSPSSDPLTEKLPVLLNVPQLNLKGALGFDSAGQIIEGTETILRASTVQGSKQHMVVVTRTNPIAGSEFPESLEMAGDSVTISGFYFDGWAADGTKPNPINRVQSALISLDGVADFVVRENYFAHAETFGITTRLSSGRIENNLFVENKGLGLNITGGSEAFPANIDIVGNHVRNSGTGGVGLEGAAQTENDRADLFNLYEFRRVPLPQFYDRTNHPEAVPDKLDTFLVGNEFSGSGLFGIRVYGYVRDYYRLAPLDPGDETASVKARFVSNVSSSNGVYGVVVDAGQIAPPANARKHVVNLHVSFETTTLKDNASGAALFGFWRYASSVSAAAESDPNFKFAHDSTITVCGDVTRFSYENRAIDPTDLTATNNVLTVNNVALQGFCVPLYGCVFELPATAARCE
jgi:hypothetical protein